MAVTGKIYGKMVAKAFSKEIDWVNDNIKIALLTSSYVPNQDTDEFFSDVVANEITGTGYTAGGQLLVNKTKSYDSIANKTIFDADDPSWANATLTTRYAVLYLSTGTDSTSPLLAYFDLGEDRTATNYEFRITVGENGFYSGTVA